MTENKLSLLYENILTDRLESELKFHCSNHLKMFTFFMFSKSQLIGVCSVCWKQPFCFYFVLSLLVNSDSFFWLENCYASSLSCTTSSVFFFLYLSIFVKLKVFWSVYWNVYHAPATDDLFKLRKQILGIIYYICLSVQLK